MSTYRFIERQRGHYAVRELCQVLDVAPSAYYAWRQRRQRPAPAWERAVCRAFARHARRYGTRWLRAELQATGYQFGRCRIRRVLRQHGLRAQQPRSFVPSSRLGATASAWPSTGCWASRRPRVRTRCG